MRRREGASEKEGARRPPLRVGALRVLALLDRQRERDVLAGARRLVGRQAEEAVAAARDRDELPAVDLVDRGHALRRRVELILPQHFARIAIVRTERAIRRRADEEQTSRGRDGTAARRVTTRARDALRGEERDLAVRNLPLDLARVQIVRGDLR